MSKNNSTASNNTNTRGNTSVISKDNLSRRHERKQKLQNVLLIWLDSNINEYSEDYQNTIHQLQKVISDINTFTNSNECIEFIESIHNNKVCMIISGYLGQHIVPCIHDMAQIDSIFIFCGDKKRHQQWTKDWSKIKDVFTDIQPICQALKQTVELVELNATPISIVASGKRADQLPPSFMYTQIIKEVLFTIHFNETHRQDFINYCRQVFANNLDDMKNIQKIENAYIENTPIWCYTFHCFLHPMLNQALRLLDGDIIIRMAFFIKDLHQHIEQLYQQQFGVVSLHTMIVLFRGEGLSTIDFEQLQQNKGGLISFNSFLSTSYKRKISLRFAEKAARNPDQVGILFIMKVNP